ncbi:GIY-YIG nuclease family protein [Bosea caraganae]|uniref:GIY-YIG nuclease family protein n=2 Tax=Bosea caraganae TaxID=2763117 RepID=A0A370LCG1_9HYPH|nr:GIY-YIG nuclease family protein [Bosea caraganae]RDJ27632.1 GIY-YIG nuclease family protein [Bosea caraganae]RDJ29646.1 GIY-YIG nuclease family protein [Bosea caraganae]
MGVYIMASGWNGTLYTGVTNSLSRRVGEHREGRGSEFVEKYGVIHLVYAEAFDRPDEAIAQEKRIKRWRRERKIALIEKGNPTWRDLYDTIHLD